MAPTFAAFMSYVRLDDKHENGRLTELCARLSGEVRLQLGEDFAIFQDRNDIAWGQQWKQRIEDTIDATTFLIPIITPGFFKSPPCRTEVERFLTRERDLGRSDLILPIYYVSCPILGDETLYNRDPVPQTIAARQYADWRELRFEPFTDPSVGKTLAGLARQIIQALDRAGPARSSSSERAPVHDRRTAAADIEGETISTERTQRLSAHRKEPPTLVVDVLHRGDYATLTEALQAAEPGHRILVRPGLYREGIVIDKAIEIIGEGEPGEVVIEASGKDVILFRANMGRAVNLTMRQMGEGKFYGVDIVQGRLDLEGCDITSMSLACVAIHGGADPRLWRNRIHDGKSAGVFVYKNGLGTLEDNEIFGNMNSGVTIASGGNPTLRRNRIHDGRSSGVFIYDDGLGTLEDNEISGNVMAGIEIRTGGNPILRRNRVHDGGGSGVSVHGNGLGTFEDNEIFRNASAGIQIRTGGNPTFRRNRIHDGNGAGVFVLENGLGVLENNDIFDNERAGISITSDGNPTIRRNIIKKNGYEAIWIYDGGRGVIEDNDLRDNTRGAFDIAEDCKANVTVQRNKE